MESKKTMQACMRGRQERNQKARTLTKEGYTGIRTYELMDSGVKWYCVNWDKKEADNDS